MRLFDRILAARGYSGEIEANFLEPKYENLYDPFLLPDMEKAVTRLVTAFEKQEKITIYGDYDIDGLTATTILIDSFSSFGFKNIEVFIPNRFTEGYGLTIDAIEAIASDGTKLIVTVDCGSLSEKEIIRANELGVDVIVTDHHNTLDIQPPAIAVINPKRLDSVYPFRDLAGVGVAFKLVQALQTRLAGLEKGQEKWLMDLVALGTVCDVVSLVDENRIFVYWGLKVISQTRRHGLKALMVVAKIEKEKLNTRSLGFGLGPRMNASGRLETAKHALDMLISTNYLDALNKAQYLDELNKTRRSEQKDILKEAIIQANQYQNDKILVLSSPNWNHGIVGIVAAKILEKYHKPTIVMQELDDKTKGSMRSFGDLSAAEAIKFCSDLIIKGGGHKLAAGLTLPTDNIESFRHKINEYYQAQNLSDQEKYLLPQEDSLADLTELDFDLLNDIAMLEPFGNGNIEPILRTNNVKVTNVKRLGADAKHLKIEVNQQGRIMEFLAFDAPDYFFVEIGDEVDIWYNIGVNEWNGNRRIEGKLLHLNK